MFINHTALLVNSNADTSVLRTNFDSPEYSYYKVGFAVHVEHLYVFEFFFAFNKSFNLVISGFLICIEIRKLVKKKVFGTVPHHSFSVLHEYTLSFQHVLRGMRPLRE
jgi:hypothetical protein